MRARVGRGRRCRETCPACDRGAPTGLDRSPCLRAVPALAGGEPGSLVRPNQGSSALPGAGRTCIVPACRRCSTPASSVGSTRRRRPGESRRRPRSPELSAPRPAATLSAPAAAMPIPRSWRPFRRGTAAARSRTWSKAQHARTCAESIALWGNDTLNDKGAENERTLAGQQSATGYHPRGNRDSCYRSGAASSYASH